MATTIDSLEIQIEQSSDKATKGLESLTESLGKLKQASKGGLGLTSCVNQLKKLEEPLNNMSNSSVDKLDALATTLEKLSNLGNLKLSPTIANNITRLSQAMDGISLSSLEILEDTVSALERMGNLGNIQVPNMRNLTPQTQSGDTTVPSGSTPVNTGEVSEAVDEVRRYTDEVNRASLGTGYWKGQLTQAATSIRSAYAPVGEAIKGAFQKAVGGATSLGNAIKNIPSRLLSGIATLPIKIGNAFRKAASGVASLASKLKEVASAKIKSGISSLASGIKNFGTGVGLANSKLGHFITSLGRIAMYRAVRFIISQFTKAIKEGTDNMYQFSKAVNGEFAQSMDRCATSFQYFKNSLGAMVAPLINALAPAIEFVIDKIVALINVINQLFARLSGASVFTKAKKQATEYASSASSAAKNTKKAAKEIKDATLGIDELNIISPLDNDDSSSSGGGSDVPNYADMFEEVKIDPKISNFVDQLKELFKAGDWEGLGTLLGEKFNEMIDKVPWADIGHKVGYYLNGAIETAYYFLKTADFKKFGKHLAEFFNAAISEVNFNTLGRLLVRKWTAIFDTVIGFLGELDWALVGKSIGDFFRGACDEAFEWLKSYNWGNMGKNAYQSLKTCLTNIDFKTVAQSFFRALGAALGAAVSFVGSFIKQACLDIWAYFKKFIKDDNGDGKTSGIEIVKGILKGVWEGIKNIGKWIKDNVFTPFIEGFKECFGIASPSKVMAEQGKYIVEGLLKGIKDHIKDGIALIKGWASSVIEWFTKGEDGKGIVEHFKDLGKNIVDGFKNKVSSTYTTVKSSITTWASKVKEWYNGDSEGAVNLRTFAGYAQNVITGFKDKIGSAYTNTKSNIITWATNVKSWFTEMGYGGVNNTNWQTFANNVITGFKDKIGSAYTNTKSNITTWASNVKSWFSDVASKSAFETFASNIITGFKDKIGNSYTNAKSNMVTFAKAVKGWFEKPYGDNEESLVDKFKTIGANIIQGFIDGVNSLWNTAMEKIKNFGKSVISKGKEGTEEHSPSKAFRQIGAFVIEGFNLGIQDAMGSSYKLLEHWTDGITSNYQPRLAFAVDTSALDFYDTKSFTGTFDSQVSARATVQSIGFVEGMEQFYKEYVEPTISQIATDTRRQADKTEQTVVQIGNRVINDAVTTQKEANGFNFTK